MIRGAASRYCACCSSCVRVLACLNVVVDDSQEGEFVVDATCCGGSGGELDACQLVAGASVRTLVGNTKAHCHTRSLATPHWMMLSHWLWACSAAMGPMPKNVGFVLSTPSNDFAPLHRCIDATFGGYSPKYAHAPSMQSQLLGPAVPGKAS